MRLLEELGDPGDPGELVWPFSFLLCPSIAKDFPGNFILPKLT
jgi:hypothetical protein